jgi:hypothetical protein
VSLAEHCAICDRTILAGERTRTYMSPKQGPRPVCDLCRKRARAMGWVDPTAAGATVGRSVEAAAVDSQAGRLDRAIERFNASPAARTVAGLTRTLGRPSVSIGAAAGSAGEARVTVAWDLCWYQWCVDIGEGGVSELDRGTEIAQLDTSARQWNATATPRGQLSMGAPHGRSRDGEPVL